MSEQKEDQKAEEKENATTPISVAGTGPAPDSTNTVSDLNEDMRSTPNSVAGTGPAPDSTNTVSEDMTKQRSTPKRSHSYTRSMRPARFRKTDPQEAENKEKEPNQQTGQTETAEEGDKASTGTLLDVSHGQLEGNCLSNEQAIEEAKSSENITTTQGPSDSNPVSKNKNVNQQEQIGGSSDESPDLSNIARASLGNQIGRFQISLSMDKADESSEDYSTDELEGGGPLGDYDHHLQQLQQLQQHRASADDIGLYMQATADLIEGRDSLRDEDGYSFIRDRTPSVSTTSSEGITDDQNDDVMTISCEPSLIERSRNSPIDIPSQNAVSTGNGAAELDRQISDPLLYDHKHDDSPLLDDPLDHQGEHRTRQPSPETIERSLSLIKRRQSYKLSRRQSMSDNDLTNVEEDVKTTAQTERKSSIVRKNAVRRKKSGEHDDPKGRHKRAQTVHSAYNSYSNIPSLRDRPPALPRRNQTSRKVMFADQASLSQESTHRSSVPNVLNGNHQPEHTSSKRRASQRPEQSLEVPQAGKQPRKLKLHCPRNAEKLKKHLRKKKFDQVERDQFDDTPLHSIVRSRRRDTHDLVMNLMVYSDFGTEEIDSPASGKDTALHLAIKNNDIFTVKILLAFGANINCKNAFGMTPLDVVQSMIAINPGSDKYKKIWLLLLELDAKRGKEVQVVHEPMPRATADIGAIREQFQKETKEVSSVELANKLEKNMNELLQQYEGNNDLDFQMALGLQQYELSGWNATAGSPLHFQTHKGKRILFLDGGGIRGLIQIEILSILEEKTGEKIVDLFDWIVGTSTGGVVALGLVYGNKTLAEIRQFYFKMKDDVFARSRFFANTNTTQALEEILKETLTSTAKLSDVTKPKVLVAAVNKTTTRPRLTFFNNCLNNEFSDEYIWKVARYTSAAPMYFSELDGYIDGGILANNPSDDGLTVIQNYYQRLGERLDIAAIVSIGAGTFPAKDLGCTDVHEMLLGMRILNIQEIQKRARNLLSLLSNALVGADGAVINCRARCQAQRIPFYRFSPNFTEFTVEADEVANVLLIDMLMETRRQVFSQWLEEIEELVQIFKQVSNEMRRERLRELRRRRESQQAEQQRRASQDTIMESQ